MSKLLRVPMHRSLRMTRVLRALMQGLRMRKLAVVLLYLLPMRLLFQLLMLLHPRTLKQEAHPQAMQIFHRTSFGHSITTLQHSKNL